LLYLGNYRFCAARFFGIYSGSVDSYENLVDMAAVLTGVEIVNGQANKAKLQMIKHKTTRDGGKGGRAGARPPLMIRSSLGND
jgi:hypothetical protein